MPEYCVAVFDDRNSSVIFLSLLSCGIELLFAVCVAVSLQLFSFKRFFNFLSEIHNNMHILLNVFLK